MLELLLLLWLFWIAAGLAVFLRGTWTPAAGARPLVRKAARRVVWTGSEVPVSLWARPLAAAAEPQRVPHHVVLAFDHSISMGSGPASPLEDARRAAVSFCRNVADPVTQVGAVEFDDQASTLCPVTGSPETLIAALEAVQRGGGTNIALGLRRAGEVLREPGSVPPDTRRMVLLLSDGGSDEAPALKEAEALEDEGVRIVTIGLGPYVNASLMREIASSESDYLHAPEPKDLQQLYRIVQESIDSAPRSGEVEEAVDHDSYVIASTGELPHSVDFAAGVVRWFVPFRRTDLEEISYRVCALRSGWHRIAVQRARLTMHGEASGQRATSNATPYVLVLPRFGWFLWVLLHNPLFWMLYGALRRGAPPVFAIDRPAQPLRRELPEAEPVRVESRKVVQRRLRPSLVIAVGHSGALAARALRYRLRAARPPLEGEPDWLWIDTGPAPGLQEGGPAGLAPPFGSGERVLMTDPVSDLFSEAQGDSPPESLRWLSQALQGEAQLYTADDLDLANGTDGRRLLGRAALFQHLRGERPELIRRLDESLERLPPESRVLFVGSTCGGTAGGMLNDLLLLLSKRSRELAVTPASVDVLLLTARRSDISDDSRVLLRNARALLTEVSRFSIRRQLPIRLAQTPGEEKNPPAVSRCLDQLFLLEEPLERDASRDSWPWAGCQSAAEFLLQLLTEELPLRQALDGNRRVREAEEESGHSLVCGAGGTARWIPVAEAVEAAQWRALFDLVSRDLLILTGTDQLWAADEDLASRARQALNVLLQGGLSRPQPALWEELDELASESAGTSVGRVLQGLVHYPGTFEIPSGIRSEELQAQVLRQQQHLLDDLLREWALHVLNGFTEDGSSDPDRRRGCIQILRLASNRLEEMVARALENLERLETRVESRKPAWAARREFLHHLYASYQVSVRGLHRRAGKLVRVLFDESREAESLGREFRREARSAEERLRRLSGELQPFVVWNAELDGKLDSIVNGIRAKLFRRIQWQERGRGCELALHFADQDGRWREYPADRSGSAALARDLRAASRELAQREVESLELSEYFDTRQWLRSSSWHDPVEITQTGHRRFSDQPPQVSDYGALSDPRVDSSIAAEVAPCLDRNRVSVVRIVTPYALFATRAFREEEGSLSPHLFLHAVDRVAARYLSGSIRFGSAGRPLSPVLRNYFCEVQRLRTFLLCAAAGLVRVEVGELRRFARLEGWVLTSEAEGVTSNLLPEAMDRFVVLGSGVGGTPTETPDELLQRAQSALEPVLAAADWRAQTLQRMQQTAGQLVPAEPRRVAEDFVGLGERFLEIEVELRSSRAGGGG